MHNEHTVDRMIASFLSRKAEEFPEVFDNAAPNPYTNVHVKPQFIDIVTR